MYINQKVCFNFSHKREISIHKLDVGNYFTCEVKRRSGYLEVKSLAWRFIWQPVMIRGNTKCAQQIWR